MLYMLFQLGGDRYALAAERIAEVLPMLQLKGLPGAAPGVLGLCNYHGRPVPVLDLSLLAGGQPAPRHWGTRLLLVRYPADGGRSEHLLGLVAEQATELLRLDDAAFVDCGVRDGGTRDLGPVASTAAGLVQRVDVTTLLPPGLRARLFASAAETAP